MVVLAPSSLQLLHDKGVTLGMDCRRRNNEEAEDRDDSMACPGFTIRVVGSPLAEQRCDRFVQRSFQMDDGSFQERCLP